MVCPHFCPQFLSIYKYFINFVQFTFSVEPEYLIESIMKTGGILLTSYSGVLGHKDLLVSTQWHYVILDEGHKIRNPEAKVTSILYY